MPSSGDIVYICLCYKCNKYKSSCVISTQFSVNMIYEYNILIIVFNNHSKQYEMEILTNWLLITLSEKRIGIFYFVSETNRREEKSMIY